MKKLPAGLRARGPAVQEAVWSRSVQLGPGGAAKLIKQAVAGLDPKASDAVVVEKIYDLQIEKVGTLFRKSPDLHPGLRKRFRAEKAALLELAKPPAAPPAPPTPEILLRLP